MRNSGQFKDLAYFRKYNQTKLVYAHLNINSVRNKFELLTEKTKRNFDILLNSDKIEESFLDSQLKIDGFSNPHKVDFNKEGGGIILLFRESSVKSLSRNLDL